MSIGEVGFLHERRYPLSASPPTLAPSLEGQHIGKEDATVADFVGGARKGSHPGREGGRRRAWTGRAARPLRPARAPPRIAATAKPERSVGRYPHRGARSTTALWPPRAPERTVAASVWSGPDQPRTALPLRVAGSGKGPSRDDPARIPRAPPVARYRLVSPRSALGL